MFNLTSNFFWQKNDSRRYPVTLTQQIGEEIEVSKEIAPSHR